MQEKSLFFNVLYILSQKNPFLLALKITNLLLSQLQNIVFSLLHVRNFFILLYIQCVPRKVFGSAVCDTICIRYLSIPLYTNSGSEPFSRQTLYLDWSILFLLLQKNWLNIERNWMYDRWFRRLVGDPPDQIVHAWEDVKVKSIYVHFTMLFIFSENGNRRFIV